MTTEHLHENVMHDNALYPISVCLLSNEGLSNFMACHWHDELEFFFLIEGKATLQIDSGYFPLLPGQAAFINGGRLHSCCAANGERCTFGVVIFDKSLLVGHTADVLQNKYLDPIINGEFIVKNPISGSGASENAVISLLMKIIEINIAEPPAYELRTKAWLYLVFSGLYENNSFVSRDDGQTASDMNRLKAVLNFIHSNYSEHIELGDLTATANMSEGYFCRFFKKVMKKTPIEYLNCYRIHKAAVLLENSDSRVVDIALETGFGSQSHFIKTFKAYHSLTPSSYRLKRKH